jgi:hypothetical protein
MVTFHMLVWNFLCNFIEIILSAHQGVTLNCSFSGNYTEHFLFLTLAGLNLWWGAEPLCDKLLIIYDHTWFVQDYWMVLISRPFLVCIILLSKLSNPFFNIACPTKVDGQLSPCPTTLHVHDLGQDLDQVNAKFYI